MFQPEAANNSLEASIFQWYICWKIEGGRKMDSIQGLDSSTSPMSVQPPPPKEERAQPDEESQEAPLPEGAAREIDTYA